MENQERRNYREAKRPFRKPPAHKVEHKSIYGEIWANEVGGRFRYTLEIYYKYVGRYGEGLTSVIPAASLSDLRYAVYKAERWIRREEKRQKVPLILRVLFPWL